MKSISETERVKNIMISAVFTIIGSMVICGCVAVLAYFEIVTSKTAQWLGILLSDGLVLLLCWYVANKIGKRRLLVSTILMGVYLFALILGKTVFFAELPMVFDWRVWLLVVSAFCGSLLASGRKKQRK